MKDLRKSLPRGYAKIGAQKFNCSERKVYNTAAGLVQSDTDLLLWLANTAKMHTCKCAEIKQVITEITDTI